MGKTLEEEVKEVLTDTVEEVAFEESLDANDSPLNQPVAENEIGHNSSTSEQKKVVKNELTEETTGDEGSEKKASPTEKKNEDFYFESKVIDDVPEQEIGGGEYDEQVEDDIFDEEEFKIPHSHSKQATDTIFGIADNVMSIGGGFFIKIKKHKEFYDFDEIIQIIEEQNEKNVRRLKLDEEDKILLRPLLITILRKRVKKLTPEEQLIGAVISILMKKMQMVMEIKAENEILVERILDVIREEKGYSDQDIEEEEEIEEEQVSSEYEEQEAGEQRKESTTTENTQEEEIQVVEVVEEAPENLSSTVLEVADEPNEEKA